MADKITINSNINAAVEKVWDYYTNPEHIKNWNSASPDWHTPSATNDLTVGGTFSYRMESKDGSEGFDFGGTYDVVENNRHLQYTLGDGRVVSITFTEAEEGTDIEMVFDAESINTIEMQRQGWQAILDNFKNYVENN